MPDFYSATQKLSGGHQLIHKHCILSSGVDWIPNGSFVSPLLLIFCCVEILLSSAAIHFCSRNSVFLLSYYYIIIIIMPYLRYERNYQEKATFLWVPRAHKSMLSWDAMTIKRHCRFFK